MEFYEEAMFEKFDAIPSGVRLARFENLDLRNNEAMGVKQKKKCIDLTVISTFSSVWMTPLPEIGTRQFTHEVWGAMKLSAHFSSLNKNKVLGTAGWIDKVF